MRLAPPPLWDHQKRAIEKATDKFALLFDPGCGKTRTAIEILKREWKSYTKGSKTLIFAPLNVCRNWEKEIGAYLGVPYGTFLVAGQTKTRKLAALQAFKSCNVLKHQFLICNTETLRSKDYCALIATSGASVVIVDEFHNFKTASSQQTKGLHDIVGQIRPKQLLLLTGTPAPQGEIDLWSMFKLLGRTADSFFLWRKKHFDDKNERRRGHPSYFPDYAIRPASRVRFQEVLAECSVVARKNEVLDLPPLLRTNIYAELSPEQVGHYKTMKDFLFAIDDDGHELNASNMLSRTLRLQQIIAGCPGEVIIKDNPRLRALEAAIAKTASGQFIVWTIFKHTYQQIAEVLTARGLTFGFLTGEQSAEERQQAMDSFQSGDLRALIAHPRAGGVGVNLTAASFSIHYTRSFSLVDDLQAEARNYRGGSEVHERITRIDIIAPDTVDEEIAEALARKETVQEFVMGLKSRRSAQKEAA